MCGGHLFTDHPGLGVIDVYAAVIEDFPYEAGVHVNYAESVLPMRDGLPKLRDMPSEMGGWVSAFPSNRHGSQARIDSPDRRTGNDTTPFRGLIGHAAKHA